MPLKKAKLSGKSEGKSAAALLSDVLPRSDSQWMLCLVVKGNTQYRMILMRMW